MTQRTQAVDGEGSLAISQKTESSDGPEVISDSHANKLDERRYQWVMNWRLVGYTAVGIAIMLFATVASYAYHSSKAASTFLSRADQAAKDGMHVDEVRWLSSYLLLHPDDREKIVRAAVAADTAADSATRENLAPRVITARKRLGVAIAYLGTASEEDDPNAELRTDLRKRLIKRLLQSGGYFYKDVERHVKMLGAERNDAEAHKWLAVAVVGQVQEMLYQPRDRDSVEAETDYYGWLANQPPGVVLREAVKRNPDDLDLITSFIVLLQTDPEAFGTTVAMGSTATGLFSRAVAALDEETSAVLDTILLDLHTRPDSRAKILLYRYAMMAGEAAKASELIKEAAAKASARLAAEEFANQSSSPDATEDAGQIGEGGVRLSEEAQTLAWDYQCVYFGAASIADCAAVTIASEDEIKLAENWLKQLRDLGTDAVPVRPELVKQTYLVSGLLAESTGDPDTAIRFWREGLTVVNDDNLDLLGNVAWALARRAAGASDDEKAGAFDEAEKAIKKFDAVIEAKKDELILLTSEISLADRTEFASAIVNADWKKRVAEATVIGGGETTSRNDLVIIQLLDGLTDDDIKLEPQIRIAGVSQLTQAYQRQQSWDLAATTLSEAAELFPTDIRLVQASGEAWTRSGNRLQANKQWQRARLSNVPQVRVASLEAEFAYQLRLLPEQRDIATLRSRVRDLQQLLEKAGETFGKEYLRLETLQAQLPPEGVGAEEYLQSSELAAKISTLATANPKDTELQMYAAERLASAGKPEEAQVVVDRLEASQDVTSDQRQLLRARVLAAAGKHTEASELLIELMKTTSEASTNLAQMAAEYAKRSGSPDLAKQALLTIPEAERTPAVYYSLYQIANLQNQSNEVQQYLSDLHRVEGYGARRVTLSNGLTETSPAYSLLIDATKIVEKLLLRGGVQKDERDYSRAKTLIGRLQSLRPNWGNAVALSGWLAFAGGDYQSAVELLRRGINAGDKQLRTRQLLWQALLTIGKDEEAEREIRLASLATQTDLDPYNEVSIGISIRKGDYAEALAAAKQIAEQNADDPIAWLVYARFALVMRSRALSGDNAGGSLDAGQLLQEAIDAIDKADKMAGAAEQKSAVASAKISLAISVGDKTKIEEALSSLQKSGLKQTDRLMLEAKALVALDRIDEAIEKLKAANELSPDFKAQMTLVRLLRSRSRGGDALEILEEAFRQDPNNPTIRTELAAQLVNSGQEIDWEQIAKLLNNDDSVTEQNRLVYALLLASKGSHYQRQEAVRLLREMAGRPNEIGLGASRVQAALMYEMVSKFDDLSQAEQKQFDKEQYLAEARRIFKQLADRENPAQVDLTRYCGFLISVNQEGDRDEVKQIVNRLKVIPGAALEVLKIEMMLAQQTGDKQKLPSIIDQWAQDAKAGNKNATIGGVETVAGEALMRNGFIDEGLAWFRRAYEANSDSFANYIVGLSMAGKFEEAAEVAADRYEESPAATTAVLLVEALIALDPEMIDPRHAQILDDAVQSYPENATFNDSVATWAMQKGERERAIAFYLKALRVDGRRLRALNNLAMIFAEIPGRELEGLQHIDNAIKLAGEGAELLDTKGTVLLRGNRVKEATVQFKRAIEEGEDKSKPRYQFHLVQALVELNQIEEAKKVWSEINFDELNPQGLTPDERKAIKELHERFGTKSQTNRQAA